MEAKENNFDKGKDDWWTPGGGFYALQRITPLRFDYFSEKARDFAGGLKGKRVLDLGCGGGILSERLALAGCEVVAIDLSPVAIETAKRHASVTGGECTEIDYRVASIEELVSGRENKFDIIVCSEVLEHVDDLAGFVAASCKLLKKSGLYLFSTINKTLKARLLMLTVAEDLLRMVPPGTHDYDRFIRPSLLVKIFSDNDITVGELKGISYLPLSREFKISKDTSVNYIGYGVRS